MTVPEQRVGHLKDVDVNWYNEPGDTTRKILVYEPAIMMMRNAFTEGFAGPLHRHPHVQASYIVSGRFEITIGDATNVMGPGDSFLIQSNLMHSVRCLEAGEIVEVFTPMRADLINRNSDLCAQLT